MEEYREIVKLGPVRLDVKSLQELESTLKADMNYLEGDYKVTLGHRNKKISAPSIKKLLEKDLPDIANELDINIFSRDTSNNINASVSLILFHNFAQFQISAKSESLYLGKKAQLIKLFNYNKPWYSLIKRLLVAIIPAVFISSLFASAFMFRERNIYAVVLLILLCISSVIIGWLENK